MVTASVLDVKTETATEQRPREVSRSQRIVSYWYRGSMNVNPLAGNGKQTLENDIRAFEQWARS
jgi:hypothetical protein